jgi:hypothetical protein
MYCSTHIGTYSNDVTPIGSLGSLGSLAWPTATTTSNCGWAWVVRGRSVGEASIIGCPTRWGDSSGRWFCDYAF